MTAIGSASRACTSDAGGRAVPILMYHALGTAASTGFARFTLHPARFAAHMAMLASEGYRTLTVGQLNELRATGTPCPPRTVLLTFDDGYSDFYDEALPILGQHGFSSTLYVTTGHVDGVATWTYGDDGRGRRMLSWSALDDVAASGVEIGAHSHTHPELDLLAASAVRAEVRRSRDELADRLGIPVTSFAYPFGYFNRTVLKAVADAGFSSACTVSELTYASGSDAFTMPRLSVNADIATETLRRLLLRRSSRAAHQVAGVKRAAWRLWRSRPSHSHAVAGIELMAEGESR